MKAASPARVDASPVVVVSRFLPISTASYRRTRAVASYVGVIPTESSVSEHANPLGPMAVPGREPPVMGAILRIETSRVIISTVEALKILPLCQQPRKLL